VTRDYAGVVHLLLSKRGAEWARNEGYQVEHDKLDYIAFDSARMAQEFVALVNGCKGSRNGPPIEWAVGSVPGALLDLEVTEVQKEGMRP
jgi:hypothetical protein